MNIVVADFSEEICYFIVKTGDSFIVDDNFLYWFGFQKCSNFHNFGVILAKLIPRCSDPDLVVRQCGIDCVHKVLKILQRYQGTTKDVKPSKIGLERSPNFKNKN